MLSVQRRWLLGVVLTLCLSLVAYDPQETWMIMVSAFPAREVKRL